jgi:hypothetical protein
MSRLLIQEFNIILSFLLCHPTLFIPGLFLP